MAKYRKPQTRVYRAETPGACPFRPMKRQLTLTRHIYPVKNLPQDTRDVLKLMKAKIKRVETCPICFERSLYVFRGSDATVRVCANTKCEAFGFINNMPDVKPSDIKKVK